MPPIPPKVTWVFVFLMVYWAWSVFWGVKGALGARSATDYFIAGRNLPYGVFILAATATSFSGWTFLGHPGLTYTDGLQYAFASFYAITIPLTGVLFLKRQWILGRHFGFVTPGEMFAAYFRSQRFRLLVVLVSLVFSVPYVGLQLVAAGFLFSVVTDGLVTPQFGMWVLTILVVSYVASGGLRTVAYVDTLQAVLLSVGIVVIGLFALHLVGGWERLMTGIAVLARDDPVRTPDGHSHYLAIPGVMQWVRDGSAAVGGPWTGTMILTYLVGLMGIQASPAFTLWAFASRTPAPFAVQQVWVSAFAMGLILVLFTAIQGIGGHFFGADRAFLDAHPDLVNPIMAQSLKGLDLMETAGQQDLLVPQLINLVGRTVPWLVGFLAVCALAAMESTASCYMAAAGAILTRDLVKPFLLPNLDDRTEKFIARLAIVLVVALALGVATTATDALVLLGGLAVSYGLQVVPALVALCYWPFLTRQGVATGLLAGLAGVTLTELVGPWWLGAGAWGRWPLTIHAAGWGLGINVAVALVVSGFTRDDGEAKEAFHAVLRAEAAVPYAKRGLIPWAWLAALSWFFIFAGPGAVIGNTLFGDPGDAADWWFGMPSLWVWQILGWAAGVGLMWLLAYGLELATAPRTQGALKAEVKQEIGNI
ncbi:MAG TPA: sodium:solute symporter family protein [Azospirillaceae bacterium]|nr:sodium:solute symporter family protein [Azospirillaceae bacterium]